MFRSLNNIERYNVCRNDNDIYSNFAVTCKYNLPLTKELISQSLVELCTLYPVFVSTFSNQGRDKNCNDYVLESVEELLYESVVVMSDQPFSEESLKFVNEIRCPTNLDKPTWRLVLFTDNYLTFLCDHALFDGQSGMNFHVEFCKIVSSVVGPKFVNTIYTKDQQYVPPPKTEDIIDLFKVGWTDYFLSYIKKLIPKFIIEWYNHPFLSTYPLFKESHPKTIYSNFRIIRLSKDQVSDLLGILKFNGVTFTAFLNVFIHYCFQNTILPSMTPKLSSVLSSIPVSGRRYYSPFKESKFRFMVSAVDIILAPITTINNEWWPIVKQVNDQIKDQIESRDIFRLPPIHSPYEYIAPDNPNNCKTFYEISNLGFNDISFNQWKITDIVFSQCIGISNTFGFTVASTPNSMNIVFSYLNEYKHCPNSEFVTFFEDSLFNFISHNR